MNFFFQIPCLHSTFKSALRLKKYETWCSFLSNFFLLYRVHDIKGCIAVLIYYSPLFFREETTEKIMILRTISLLGFPESAVPALQEETHGCH